MKEKIHHSSYQKALELYLLCVLNENEIKRKFLEDYLLDGNKTKRIPFKNVYLKLFKNLNIKISEITKEDKGKGRYNPVYWNLDFNLIIDDFAKDLFIYLMKNNLTTSITQEILINEIKLILKSYVPIWKENISLQQDYLVSFDWKIKLLILQISMLAQSNSNLFRYFPIYLALSPKYSLFEEKSINQRRLESEWKTKLIDVSLHLDIITFYESMIAEQLKKELVNVDKTIFQSLKQEIFNGAFSNHIDFIVPHLKNQMNSDQPISYVLSPSPPRDEGFWFLLLAIKENFLKEINKNKNDNLSQAIREFKDNNTEDFQIRNNILVNCIFQLMLTLLDPKIPISEHSNFIFGYKEENEEKFWPLFSFGK